jgi:hypothetical protein
MMTACAKPSRRVRGMQAFRRPRTCAFGNGGTRARNSERVPLRPRLIRDARRAATARAVVA